MRGCIKKRGKSWAVIIYLGRDDQGKRRYKWYTHPTRREAEAHLGQLLASGAAGGIIPTTRRRLGEYLESWLGDYAAGAVSPVTLARYRSIVHVHLVPALGHIPILRLTPQALQGYLSRKLAKGLSSTTMHHHYRLLHGALKHAVRWNLLPRNPAEMVDPPRRQKQEMHVWDEEQVRLFLAEAKRSSPHHPLYLAAILTGMRQGELLGLRWKDVDLAVGVASVQQTFYQLGRQQIFKAPKTPTARRTVVLPSALVDELRRLNDRQAGLRRFFGGRYIDHDLIFCQSNGRPLRANNLVRRDFRRIIERAGLPRIRFHDLRHTHATHLLKDGAHPKVVQERLGHSSPAFTLHVYSHVLPGMQEEAARRLAARLLGRPDSGISRD